MFKEAFGSTSNEAFSAELSKIAQLIQKILEEDHIDLLKLTENYIANKKAEAAENEISKDFGFFTRLFEIIDDPKISAEWKSVGSKRVRLVKRLLAVSAKNKVEQNWFCVAFKQKPDELDMISINNVFKQAKSNQHLYALISVYKMGNYYELACYICSEIPDAHTPIVPQFRLPFLNNSTNFFSFDPNLAKPKLFVNNDQEVAQSPLLSLSSYYVDLSKGKNEKNTKKLWKSMDEDSAEYEYSFENTKVDVEILQLDLIYRGDNKNESKEQFEKLLSKTTLEITQKGSSETKTVKYAQAFPLVLKAKETLSFKVKAPKRIYPHAINCFLSPDNLVSAEIVINNHYDSAITFKQIKAYSDTFDPILSLEESKELFIDDLSGLELQPGQSHHFKIRNTLEKLDQQPLFLDFVFVLQQKDGNKKDVYARLFVKNPNDLNDPQAKIRPSQKALILEDDQEHEFSVEILNKLNRQIEFTEIKAFDKDFRYISNLNDLAQRDVISFWHDLDHQPILKDDSQNIQIKCKRTAVTPFLLQIHFQGQQPGQPANTKSNLPPVEMMIIKNQGSITFNHWCCQFDQDSEKSIHQLAAKPKNQLSANFEIKNTFIKSKDNAQSGDFKLIDIKGYDIYFQKMSLSDLVFEKLSVGSIIPAKSTHTFTVKVESKNINIGNIPLYVELHFQNLEDLSVKSLKFYLQTPSKVDYPESKTEVALIRSTGTKRVPQSIIISAPKNKSIHFQSLRVIDKALNEVSLESIKDSFEVLGLDKLNSQNDKLPSCQLSLSLIKADEMPKALVFYFKDEKPVVIYLQGNLQNPNFKTVSDKKSMTFTLNDFMAKVSNTKDHSNQFCFREQLESQKPVSMKKKSLIQDQDKVQFILQYARDLQNALVTDIKALNAKEVVLPHLTTKIRDMVKQYLSSKDSTIKQAYPFEITKDFKLKLEFSATDDIKELHSLEVHYTNAHSVLISNISPNTVKINKVILLDDAFDPIEDSTDIRVALSNDVLLSNHVEESDDQEPVKTPVKPIQHQDEAKILSSKTKSLNQEVIPEVTPEVIPENSHEAVLTLTAQKGDKHVRAVVLDIDTPITVQEQNIMQIEDEAERAEELAALYRKDLISVNSLKPMIYLDRISEIQSSKLHVALKPGSFLSSFLDPIKQTDVNEKLDLSDLSMYISRQVGDELSGVLIDDAIDAEENQDLYYMGSVQVFNYLQRINKVHLGLFLFNVIFFSTMLKYIDGKKG